MDLYRISMFTLVTLALTGMRAYSGGKHRKRIVLHNDLRCFFPVAFADLGHISRNVRSCRTFNSTRCFSCTHASKYGMISVVSQNPITLLSAFSCTVQSASDLIWITVEPAAHILAHIASYGSQITYKGSCHTFCCFCQCRSKLFDLFIFSDLTKPCHCLYCDRSIFYLDPFQVFDSF